MSTATAEAPVAERLGNTVRALRKAHGLTQRDVAARIGMHFSNYSKVEAGQRALSLEAVATLSEMFAVSIDDIVSGRAAVAGDPDAIPADADAASADAIARARLIDSLKPDDRAIVFRLIDSLVSKQRLRDYLEANLDD